MRALALPLRRPIAVGAVYAAIGLLALFTLPGLPLSLAPDTDLPRLSIFLRLENASPETMEGLVTAPVESEVHRIRGVEEIWSTSGRGWAQIDVSFARDTRMDRAEVFVRERLAALQEDLPRELTPPEVTSYQTREDAGGRFFAVRAAGPRTAESLRSILEETAAPRLAAVPGVSAVTVYGGGRRELRVDIDPEAVARGLVTVDAISRAIDSLGEDDGVGAQRDRAYRVPQVLSRPEASAEAASAQIVGERAGVRVRARDVASVLASWGAPRRISRVNGEPAVLIALEREPGSNVLRVAKQVRETLGAIEAHLPPDVDLEVLSDQSERIGIELDALGRRSLLSVVALFLVLWIAQRSWRAPLVVLSAVFSATLITALLFRGAGLGMNLVTLSGLALALGMAVDSSIVVLQSLAQRAHRAHRAHCATTGERRDRALTVPVVVAGLRGVLLPLLAGTLTTAVVMAPFLYLTGDLRAYYLPFVLAIGLSLTAAFAVALTLTPVLGRWALRAPEGEVAEGGGGPNVATRLPRRIARGAARLYEGWLRFSVRRPWPVAVVAVLALAGSLWIFEEKVSRGALFPDDPETGLEVSVAFPEGTELARTEETMADFERLVLESPSRKRGWISLVNLGVSESRGRLSVRFHPAVAFTTVPEAVKEELTFRAAAISGAEVSVSGHGPGFSTGRSFSSPSYQLTVKGPDYLELGRLAEALGGRLAQESKVREIDTNASSWMVDDATEQVVRIDREALARLGLSVRELLSVVQPAVAGDLAVRELRDREGSFDARVRFAGEAAPTREELLGRLLRTPEGVAVPLSAVLSVEERPIPGEIRRHEQEYTRSITFDFKGPARVGNRFVRSFVKGTSLPPGYTIEEGLGLFLTRGERQELGLALGVALALIYMVAAALFESFVLPFVALLAVPLAFTGVPFAFWSSGEAFDRTAYIGLILLSGIAINSALLLVHRAGMLRRRGLAMPEAARQAARERARPILLTTTTSVVGLLPLALTQDASAAEGWRALALASSSGLAAAALVTLFVVPSLLVLFTRRKQEVQS